MFENIKIKALENKIKSMEKELKKSLLQLELMKADLEVMDANKTTKSDRLEADFLYQDISLFSYLLIFVFQKQF